MSHEALPTQQLKSLPEKYIGSTGTGTSSVAVGESISTANSLNEILAFARTKKVSDIHLTINEPIVFRQCGKLVKIGTDSLSADRAKQILKEGLPLHIFDEALKRGDKEYVYTLEGFGRFRMAIVRQRLGLEATIRLIPLNIPSFEESGMPASCASLTKWAQGLVIVAGPAGCGKTTTLSILVEMINKNRHDHIICIEDPIEYVFKPLHCQFTQREINLHTHSQQHALRAAMREDPDVIVVSELRDLVSIQLAISAAETGHLVIGTMNTLSAAQTISRIVDSFPADEQGVVRNMISESLRGVICQQLLPSKDGQSLVAAYEVLLVTAPVSNMIREGKIGQINNAMMTGKAAGMQLMDVSIKQLLTEGKITPETAKERIKNPQLLQ